MSAKNFSAIRRKLLSWYENNKRDLPWRRSRDPYAIWIAEVMLQQTQVKTALPYYERFLDRFPTVEALARAPLERVLRLWSGLGYYRRAENLKLAARQLVRQHRGKIPENYAQLRALAGVGDYTAGAILSIAFEKPFPAIDGNVRRVLGRLYAVTNAPALRAIATELIAESKPREFNQALMELGATVCVARVPNCAACPLARECASRARHPLMATSRRSPGARHRDVTWPLAIVRHGGKILLRRRGADGLLARLWELPGAELTRGDKPLGALRRQLRALPIKLAKPRRIGEIRHSITYRRIHAPVYLFDCAPRCRFTLPRAQWRWRALRAVARSPVSSMTNKAISVLTSHEKRAS